MKFKAEKMELSKTLDGLTKITLIVPDKSNKLATQLNGQITAFTKGISVDLNKWRERRSNEHNALFWEICTYCADNIDDPLITPTDVYRQAIRRFGISTVMPIEDDILDMTIKTWESRGDGWLTQKERKSKLQGNYTNVRFWFGSSVYDSKQFYRLVEGLKHICVENSVDISVYNESLSTAIKSYQQLELKKEEEVKNEKQLYHLQ